MYQDAEGKIILANPAAEPILDFPLDQMQGCASVDPRWRAIHEDGTESLTQPVGLKMLAQKIESLQAEKKD